MRHEDWFPARRLRAGAGRCARLLDECGSESEFRLRCAALNLDPDEVFAPYAQFVPLARGYAAIGLTPKFGLSDWYAFEKIPGAVKPDPWCSGYVDPDFW